MAVIFTASADAASVQHSSRIIAPLLRWLFPHISDSVVNAVVLVARKCAHLTEYSVLAILFWRALRKPLRNDPRTWSWAEGGWSILLVALYAASDEIHQIFVPTRGASFHDVVIDTFGGILGILLVRGAFQWRRRSRREFSA